MKIKKLLGIVLACAILLSVSSISALAAVLYEDSFAKIDDTEGDYTFTGLDYEQGDGFMAWEAPTEWGILNTLERWTLESKLVLSFELNTASGVVYCQGMIAGWNYQIQCGGDKKGYISDCKVNQKNGTEILNNGTWYRYVMILTDETSVLRIYEGDKIVDEITTPTIEPLSGEELYYQLVCTGAASIRNFIVATSEDDLGKLPETVAPPAEPDNTETGDTHTGDTNTGDTNTGGNSNTNNTGNTQTGDVGVFAFAVLATVAAAGFIAAKKR